RPSHFMAFSPVRDGAAPKPRQSPCRRRHPGYRPRAPPPGAAAVLPRFAVVAALRRRYTRPRFANTIRSPLPADAMMEPHYRHLRCSTANGVLVLTITEALVLDEDVADLLRQDLIGAVEYHKPPGVVVCFHRVKAVSSVVFRPLISLQRRVQAADGGLVLCCLAGMPGEVFRITGLIGEADAPFDTEPDTAAAVKRLTKR